MDLNVMDSSVEKIQVNRLASSYANDVRFRTLCVALLMTFALALAACGGSGSGSPQSNSQAAGNWQFTLTSGQQAPSFGGGLQGGFLQQNGSSISGQAVYTITLPAQNGNPTCDSGTATIAGKISGQTAALTAVAGSVTYALTGTISSSGSGPATITGGTYTATPAPGSPCGTASDTGTLAGTSVPPLTGAFKGFFHSVRSSTGFGNQDFPLTGTLLQGENTGAASATVTGTLVFQDPKTLVNDYPCLSTASVTGTISGSTVLLQIYSAGGTAVGQIGQTPGSPNPPTAVTYESAQKGYVVHNPKGAVAGSNGGGYLVTTKPCSGGDSGNLCLALNGSTSCDQPISFSPFALTFIPKLLGTASTPQTITLANTSSAELTGLSLKVTERDSAAFYQSGGDFNGVHSFSTQDTCTPESSFTLAPSGQQGSTCTITVAYTPQQSCSWLPSPVGINLEGTAPVQCPVSVGAILTVTVPSGSADADNEFSVPITGLGLSAITPSVAELDFGAQALGEASPPQSVTFTNQSPNPIQILPAVAPCSYPTGFNTPPLPRPPVDGEGSPLVSGIAVAAAASISGLNNSGPIINDSSLNTVRYFCDTDPPKSLGGSGSPNFQISADSCSGQTLQPSGQAGASCTVEVTFVPQPATWKLAALGLTGLDDFLELNTAWCGDANHPAEANCEIDSGRFPVEIKTNPPSPLRMTPAAAIEFGTWPKGTSSDPLTITIFNDPVDPASATVNFVSKIVSGSDFAETDNCPASLAPNDSCQVSVIFTPHVVGPDSGSITLTYNSSTQSAVTQKIFMRGMGQ
jgi:hypothetical protein